LTLRELFWAVEGKQRQDWTHTASLAAVLINLHRGKRTKAVEPRQLMPAALRPPRREPDFRSDVSILKAIWCQTSKGENEQG
jgi:hypothetical protein